MQLENVSINHQNYYRDLGNENAQRAKPKQRIPLSGLLNEIDDAIYNFQALEDQRPRTSFRIFENAADLLETVRERHSLVSNVL